MYSVFYCKVVVERCELNEKAESQLKVINDNCRFFEFFC
jgi:hypothetical protein